MRFKLSGVLYSLVFHHSVSSPNLEFKMDDYNPQDAFGETEAILYTIDTTTEDRTEVDRAVSRCAPEDNFVKSIGRKISIQRLLKNAKIDWMEDKGWRKRFWEIYFSKTAEMEESIYVKYFGCSKVTNAYNGMKLKPTED